MTYYKLIQREIERDLPSLKFRERHYYLKEIQMGSFGVNFDFTGTKLP